MSCLPALGLALRYGGAYFGRAQVFHSQGKYQEALTDYQTALRIRPDMRWQIEPYMQDVQEKFVEKAAAAEAVRSKRLGPTPFQSPVANLC